MRHVNGAANFDDDSSAEVPRRREGANILYNWNFVCDGRTKKKRFFKDSVSKNREEG